MAAAASRYAGPQFAVPGPERAEGRPAKPVGAPDPSRGRLRPRLDVNRRAVPADRIPGEGHRRSGPGRRAARTGLQLRGRTRRPADYPLGRAGHLGAVAGPAGDVPCPLRVEGPRGDVLAALDQTWILRRDGRVLLAVRNALRPGGKRHNPAVPLAVPLEDAGIEEAPGETERRGRGRGFGLIGGGRRRGQPPTAQSEAAEMPVEEGPLPYHIRLFLRLLMPLSLLLLLLPHLPLSLSAIRENLLLRIMYMKLMYMNCFLTFFRLHRLFEINAGILTRSFSIKNNSCHNHDLLRTA